MENWQNAMEKKNMRKNILNKLKSLLLVSKSLISTTYDLDLAFQGH